MKESLKYNLFFETTLMEAQKEAENRIRFNQIFETLNVADRKTKVICTLG